MIFVDKGDGTKERFDISVYLKELLAYAHKEDAGGTGKFMRELRIDIDENTCLWLYDVGLSVRSHRGREDITAQIKGVLLKR